MFFYLISLTYIQKKLKLKFTRKDIFKFKINDHSSYTERIISDLISSAGDNHSDVGSDGNRRRRLQTNFHHGIYMARILMASLIISQKMAAWAIICYQFQLEKLLILLLYKLSRTPDCFVEHPPLISCLCIFSSL